MPVKTEQLVRASAVALATAGAIFVAVQINHPPMDAATAQTTDWLVRSSAKAVMSALALGGLTGLYLRQLRESKVLGLVGYLVFAAGYLTMFSVETIAALVLPTLAASEPEYVTGVLVSAAGGTPAVDIGGMQVLLSLSGGAYLIGGLVFGIALLRARVVARSASLLLAIGTVATASLAFLPEVFNRPMAVPVGIALIGLGVSLWRHPKDESAQVGSGSRDAASALR